jgi:hypothetical protein
MVGRAPRAERDRARRALSYKFSQKLNRKKRTRITEKE